MTNDDVPYEVVVSYTVWDALRRGVQHIRRDDRDYWIVQDVPRRTVAAHVKKGIFEDVDMSTLCPDGATLTALGRQLCEDLPEELTSHAKLILGRRKGRCGRRDRSHSRDGLELLRKWPDVAPSVALVAGTLVFEKSRWIPPTDLSNKVLRHLCKEGYLEMGIANVKKTPSGDLVPTLEGPLPAVVWRKTPAGEMRGI